MPASGLHVPHVVQPPFSQTAQYVRDLLDEYAHASKGKLKWEAIDPGEDAKLEEEATKMKVPKMRRGRTWPAWPRPCGPAASMCSACT